MKSPKKVESSANPKIRELKKIHAGKNKSYWIIEGKTLVFEAIKSNVELDGVYMTPDMWKLEGANIPGADVYLISSKLMRDVTTLETPPGILAVARKASQEPKQAPAGTAIFANSIRDPGNLGTLIRSAEAAGCEFLACSHDTVDPYSPKVLRASMGSIFRVSVFKVSDTKSYLESLRTIGVAVYALSPHKGINLFAFRTKRPFVLIVGGETAGLPSEYEPDGFLKIPMSDKVESLNAAVAGSIAIFVLSNPRT